MAVATSIFTIRRRDTGCASVFTRSSNRWSSIGRTFLSNERKPDPERTGFTIG
jgi:hypothetical protein